MPVLCVPPPGAMNAFDGVTITTVGDTKYIGNKAEEGGTVWYICATEAVSFFKDFVFAVRPLTAK